jgi:alkylation response protein AidB-like acyl-CoA dehydrogenase
MIDPADALQSEKVQKLKQVAETDFRARADRYDRECAMPTEDIDWLFKEGWLTTTLSKEIGGMGSNLDTDDPGTYLQGIRMMARGAGAAAHCLQLNCHTLWMMEGLATEDQKERLIKPAFERPFMVSSVGSEPTRKHMYTMSTIAKPVDGGYVLNGVKNYATNGPGMDLLVVFASLDGVEHYLDNHMMFMIEPDAKGMTVDNDWYRPLGMRGAPSPLVHLKDVFVPKENVLGEAGSYPRQRWQGKYHLGFAAQYLGVAEGMFDWYRDYVVKKGKGKDPIILMRTGEMRIKLDAAQAVFHDAIRIWRSDRSTEDRELLSVSAKYTCAHHALDISRSITQAAGSTALFEEFPLGRMIRDLTTHTLHAGHDKTAQIVGQSQLGETFDSTLQR